MYRYNKEETTMLKFSDLKIIISKCCSTEKTDDLSKKYHFSIDYNKLENELQKQEIDLHVMSFFDTVYESRKPDLEDVQLLSEYAYDQSNFGNLFFNGNCEFIQFMLFTSNNGEVWSGNMKEYSDCDPWDMFNKLNGDEIDMELVKHIVNTAPIYRVIITKRFNQDRDRFDYNIIFRSNSKMLDIVRGNNDK